MKRFTQRNKPIVLLTDFGMRDGFAGTMKAVILALNPKAPIIDLTHEIAPQDVSAAAYVLWSSYSFFPRGTIFVAVVDPGVGTVRRILCAKGRNHIFLAPDNGILKYLEADGVLRQAWEVGEKKHFPRRVSHTFHGRDIFAPMAARLSLGLRPSRLGKEVALPRTRSEFTYVTAEKGRKFFGSVIYIDRFGNLITNLRVRPEAGSSAKGLRFRIKRREIQGLVQSYAEGQANAPLALVNSSNLIELGLKNGSAREFLGAKVGEKVFVETWCR
jgi:S-adenosylmethionine hydrolase